MCGINGIVRYRYDERIASDVKRMNDLIIHRGPDDAGVFCELGNPSIAMGMRRLSIIDLSTGSQPMYSDDGNRIIVFNGEIYNYKALKLQLEKEGMHFKTTSDTEVILRGYERYGNDIVAMLDGMFAFSILDKTRHKIIMARDFFGEKPLYYCKTENEFCWGSELKSVAAVINSENLEISQIALSLYFQLTYIPAPFTIYKNMYKLEQNTILEYDLRTNTITQSQIQNDNQTDYSGITEKEAINICFDKVYASVVSRSVADVPIGTFLSGGVDSTVVSWCLAQNTGGKIDTFSIGFENKQFDESAKARTVAKQINSRHHEFIVEESDLSANIDKIVLNFDEPFADSSALVTWLVANKTTSSVKVALIGDGGDEVFGGYNKYYIGHLNSICRKIVPLAIFQKLKGIALPLLNIIDDNRGLRFKLRKLINSIDYDDDFYYNIIALGFADKELCNLLNDYQGVQLKQSYKEKIGVSGSNVHDFRYIDKHISLEGDMLVKVDRTSMLSSLECRAPFLNRDLWNFANCLPENYLIRGTRKKYLLKKAFEKYFPDHFFEKPKQGFAAPVGNWLRNSLKAELIQFTDEKYLRQQDLFNIAYIQKLVSNHLNKKEDNTFKVWTFFCFQKWYANTVLKK